MKKALALAAGILLAAANLYAGNGDLIVNGNLGVGTASPNGKLEILKDTSVLNTETDYAIRITESTADIGMLLGVSAANDVGLIQTLDPGTAWGRSLALQPNGGNVGIGTATPNGKLEILKDTSALTMETDYAIRITESTADTGMLLGVSAANDVGIIQTLDPGTAWGRSLALQPNGGNVGIGTTNPQGYKLFVSGEAYTTIGWQGSDIRLKKNILPVEGALDKVLKLNGVSYEWKHGKDFEGETSEAFKLDDEGKVKDDKYRNLPEGRTVGVIAQELEKVLPEAVNTGEDGIKAVSYSALIPVLIEAMKEQQKQITAQLEEIKAQQMRIEELEKKVSLLK